MKTTYEFVCDDEYIALDLDTALSKAHLAGHRIIWNHKGMRGVVPPAVLEAQYTLIREYFSRLRYFDCVPTEVGKVLWESVVRVPSPDCRADHLTSEDA